MTRDDLFDEIMDVLQDLSDYELIDIWNEYCDMNGYDDDRIYYRDEIDELAYGMSPLNIIETYGAVADCTYFKFTIWGAEECWYDDIEYDDLIEYMIDREWSNGNSDIMDLIEEWLESDDEEEEE